MEFYDIFVAGNVGVLKVRVLGPRAVGRVKSVMRPSSLNMFAACSFVIPSPHFRVWPWLSQGSQYLNLPLSIFKDFDPEETGEINLYQLFLMLTLFCVGEPELKAALW
jgi:hypothetical protein